MRQLSILSLLLVVILLAIVFTLFVRIHEEVFFYITGPLVGAMLASLAYPYDRSALLTGGVVGGLCQGILAVMVFKRGYVFPDIAMITGPLYLANLAVHLVAGLGIGVLLYLALRWARPRSVA